MCMVCHDFSVILAFGHPMCNAGSDIIRVNMLGTNFVITNSLEASTDLLDKRSSIYSDRYVFSFKYGASILTLL